MDPADLIAARHTLGKREGKTKPISQHELARRLRMNGKSAWQSVHEWESGKRPIPGPVQIAVQCLLRHGE